MFGLVPLFNGISTSQVILEQSSSSSSSSCRATSTDIPGPLSPLLLTFIAFGRSPGLHPVSSQRCCIQVRVGRPAFARPCEGVHRRTSLMISSLLLQQCPACQVRLTLMVFVMGGKWPYSCCFVGCCLQDLFKIARSILVQLLSTFFSICLVSVHVVHPYSSIDTTAAWKKLLFILQDRSDFHMTASLSISVQAFVSRVSISFSVDETQLQYYIIISWRIRGSYLSQVYLSESERNSVTGDRNRLLRFLSPAF